jgi:hypothetical protein|tara:strand:+ start:408 stop:584 length:177 start_codon:yes stop_codon:yes gene_type:complete
MKKRELTKAERIEKLIKRRDFLTNELAAADRLDGWHLKGLTEELKTIRLKLTKLEKDL